MLDFIFRRNNPTNSWRRSPTLTLTAALDRASLNEVTLGSPIDRLSSLGRNDITQLEMLCYLDLGIGIECEEDATLYGYTIVLIDEHNEFQPYQGTLTWENKTLNANQITRNDLVSIFGDWHSMESDDIDSTVFYEFADYQMVIECTSAGAIKRFNVQSD